MADEARALTLEARAQSSEHLQVILDHIKDVVLALDADGAIRTFNPTGERVFGYAEAKLVGRRIDLLIPQLAAAGETVPQALQRLAEALGDTALDLAASEQWARRKDGQTFAAEIAVGKAPTSRRAMFVLCLRDVTERRESEQAMRESEARYRLLVDHAPEAIVVLDVETGRFVDANDNAQKLFGMDRAHLLAVGPVQVSPALQPDGQPSLERARNYIEQALAGEPQIFEWSHYDGAGRQITCEVRLVRIPSASRHLVRGSIADISGRKRSERMAAAEREVFEQITGNVPLPQVLTAITRLVESVGVGTVCPVSVLAEGGHSFTHLIAPQLPDTVCAALTGSGAAVYLGHQVLVADVALDPQWGEPGGPRGTQAHRRGLRAGLPPGAPAADRATAKVTAKARLHGVRGRACVECAVPSQVRPKVSPCATNPRPFVSCCSPPLPCSLPPLPRPLPPPRLRPRRSPRSCAMPPWRATTWPSAG